MKCLLFVLLLAFVACSPEQKVYTYVEIGMYETDFYQLCGRALRDDESKIVTNTQNSTQTARLSEANSYVDNKPLHRTEKGCVGTFTFVNGKLDTIIR